MMCGPDNFTPASHGSSHYFKEEALVAIRDIFNDVVIRQDRRCTIIDAPFSRVDIIKWMRLGCENACVQLSNEEAVEQLVLIRSLLAYNNGASEVFAQCCRMHANMQADGVQIT